MSLEDLCCGARPAKGVRTGQDPFADSKKLTDGDDEDNTITGRAMSMFGGGKKSKAAKQTNGSDGDGDGGSTLTSMLSFGLMGGKSSGLPPNWKKVKDKEGKVAFVNTITQVQQYHFPRALPQGWTEALHKESGRPYYVHKASRKTQFSFPTEDDAVSQVAEEDDGFINKTMSFMTGGAVGKKEKKKKEAEEPKKAGGTQKVYISCTALIKEMKLCVDEKQQAPLNKLLEDLLAHKVSAEQAVQKLQALVGTTLVQQAGMSVMNAKTGALPHGWLEYMDDASKRPYYYNVHTKVTSWYKPKPTDVSEKAQAAAKKTAADNPLLDRSDRTEEEVQIDFKIDTHNIAYSAEL